MILYVVHCRFDDPALGHDWLAWLRDEHLAAVCAAGALDARVLEVPGPSLGYEVHYRFADASAFEAYERDHAPRLRAEGLARFPPERGLHCTRRVDPIVAYRGPAGIP